MWRCMCDPTFSHFDTLLARDMQMLTHTHTDIQTQDDDIYHASIAARSKYNLHVCMNVCIFF